MQVVRQALERQLEEMHQERLLVEQGLAVQGHHHQARQLQSMLVEILCAQDLHQNGRKASVASWPPPQTKKTQNHQALLHGQVKSHKKKTVKMTVNIHKCYKILADGYLV